MQPLHHLGNGQSPLGVRKPVEIDPEYRRLLPGDITLNIEPGTLHHPVGKVDYLNVVVVLFQE